jgi:UDP-galactopyranose mutase
VHRFSKLEVSAMKSIIVFSHLRWDFVYQRPQHLMRRLAKHYRIFFVEEPVFHADESFMQVSTAVRNVYVCRPHTPVSSPGFHDEQLSTVQPLLEDLVVEYGILKPLAWLYTPMALPLVHSLEPEGVIYDCMDELSAFAQAPRQLLQREHALFTVADLVFTGGVSLYQAKKQLHHNVHCFPSSVEREHFAAALEPDIDHPDQKNVARPRLGYFGVIDERIDLHLLETLADVHPEWELILVGPVVKIDPSTLPRRPNIHYFGQRSYSELPQFVAGWDVCLLPFAINAATRFISPTKTLEYMAAEKPIVSTPITDVAGIYGQVVHIAERGPSFAKACELALDHSADRSEEVALMREIVTESSWDSTAEGMHELIENLTAEEPSVLAAAPRSSRSAVNTKRVVIIGAGPTGLSAALHLGKDSVLLEQNKTVGGWCRSIEDNGFVFDYAGHIMFSNDPYVHMLYERLLGDNVHWQDREAWIYSHDVYTRYPFQGALFGLPPTVLRDCLVGAIEARFGPLKTERCSAGTMALRSNSSATAAKAESITDCCADGTDSVGAVIGEPLGLPQPKNSPRNFEEFIHAVWGSGVAKHFALPYNQKLWAVPLSQMETSWLGGRVPLPDLEQMIDGALRPVPKPMGPNARFGYPLRGGFQALMNGFLPHLRGELKLNSRVARVIPSRHQVELHDGTTYAYEHLVSTMPLPLLVALSGAEVPVAVREAASRLQHVSVRCVNLGIARSAVTDKHWIYYPGNSVFHRVFVQGNASPYVNPPGGFGLTCEITYSPLKPLPCDGDALIQRCIEDCRQVGLLRADDEVIVRNQVDMPYAYVVYDHTRARNVEVIRRWLNLQDIWLAGRYSEWEYYNSDHAFLAGRRVALEVMAAIRTAAEGSVPESEDAASRGVPAAI